MMRYSCDIHTIKGWETIALFNKQTSLAAMVTFALGQCDYDNSLVTPYDAINIINMDTGEILWDSYSYFHDIDNFELTNIDDNY